ncbi:MAG: hypothetical protein U5L09_18370 [Bacteroidales bacterium]|nr:hypothetical protein [Bacteroidales bacterium]
MGWTLLNNDHALLERQGKKIAIVGVENWSAYPRFPKRGDMQKALKGTEDIPVKLLSSHRSYPFQLGGGNQLS